jgi:hypothetical protein
MFTFLKTFARRYLKALILSEMSANIIKDGINCQLIALVRVETGSFKRS